MLKFISPTQDLDYEEILFKDINISKGIIIKIKYLETKINEYISNVKAEELHNLLKAAAERIGNKKSEEFVDEKLLLLISLFTAQRNFQYDENTKAAFENVIKLITYFTSNNNTKLINALFDVYFILPENSYFKFNLLITLLNRITASEIKAYVDRIKEVILDINKKDLAVEDYSKIYTLLAKIIDESKLYEAFSK